MKNLKDQLNRGVNLKDIPKRIVSLVPSQTELLVDLGLRDCIVGVTKFCVHPKDLRQEKTIVGGTKTIKVEKIKALKPDVILCNKEENPIEIIEALKDVAPIHISDVYTMEDAYQLIKMYGDIFNIEKQALQLISDIESERHIFQDTITCGDKKKVTYFIWKAPWMVAASHTFIDTMLAEAGFINVFKDENRYPEIDLNHPKLKDADVLLLSSEPFPFKEKHVVELRDFFPKKTIQIVDGELFSWYGSRLKNAFTYFETFY